MLVFSVTCREGKSSVRPGGIRPDYWLSRGTAQSEVTGLKARGSSPILLLSAYRKV